MIIRKGKDVEVEDRSAAHGSSPMSITRKWLIHNEVGDDSYGHRFAVREFMFKPGTSGTMHKHKYVEAVYIVSGRVLFKNDREEVELEPGDVAYTYSEEPHYLTAIGDTPVKFIMCIDCINGCDNCSPTRCSGSIPV